MSFADLGLSDELLQAVTDVRLYRADADPGAGDPARS